MRVLLGWGLDGPSRTGRESVVRVGEPAWGPTAMLRDLELRLALPPVTNASASVRVPRYAARIRASLEPTSFHATSFGADDIGTAATLLAWRDELVIAGWRGLPTHDGGPRLAALSAIEHAETLDPLPLGLGDRLARVLTTMNAEASASPYEAIELVEPLELWPALWQQVFFALGCPIDNAMLAEPIADPDSDLGLLQQHLRGAPVPGSSVKGDGSLLLVRGDTPGDLAELVAGLVAEEARVRDITVVRALDPAPLDAALRAHGLASQGLDGQSAWRPTMQVLPLAVELAFGPRDPHRVLELLTLPIGPFRGALGGRLARAVARQPGINGQEWRRQKQDAIAMIRKRQLADGKSESEADAHIQSRLLRLAEWVEAPGVESASRSAMVAVATRVQDWLRGRLAEDADLYAAAYHQAEAFARALVENKRETYSLQDARYLLDRLTRDAQRQELQGEEAGRIPHVSHPSALLAASSTVVVWNFVSGAERRPARPPWNARELEALAAHQVVFPEPAALLKAEADAWRRVALAASERLVLVVPGAIQGAPMAPHSFWDEIAARLGLEAPDVLRLTRTARGALEGRELLVPVEGIAPLELPAPRATWELPAELLALDPNAPVTHATSLETLASCPLSWVLSERAKVRSGAISKIANGPLLNGSLTHRLVEELFLAQAFGESEPVFLSLAKTAFAGLLETEGATMLLRGASFEKDQLTEQVLHAMRELYRWLQASEFRIAAVEEVIEAESSIGKVRGRLDLRLVDPSGRAAILDLKWGAATYEKKLQQGRAVQLAVYARAVTKSTKRTSLAPAGYFGLKKGAVVAADNRMKAPRPLDGPGLDVTMTHVEATVSAVLARYREGKIPVAATKNALPLLDALGIPTADQQSYYSRAVPEDACEYCAFDALCGRRWEAIA